MKITKEIFEKSFYSIGGGFDIEPVLRFSHICEFFINVNLFIEKENAIKWYGNAFKYCKDVEVLEKIIIDEFDEVEFYELNENYITHLTNPDFISREDLKFYQKAFSQAIGLKQYAIIYKLYRKSVNRKITYCYCTAEGLASYLTLSQNGTYAPIVLSTIETGVLEDPEGIFNSFFRKEKKKHPKLWIRGFEPRYLPFKLHNNSLDSIELFRNKVLDFNSKWTCGWSYYPRQQKIERHCKGFVSDEILSELNTLSMKEEFTNKNHLFLFEHLDKNFSIIKKDDYVITSKKTSLNLDETHCNIIYWEDFTSSHHWRRNDMVDFYHMISVNEQIEKLSDVLNQMKLSTGATIHLIPFCLEDEGVSYYNSIIKLKFKTMTYLPNAYDFIDLKEVNSHLKQH